MVSMIRDNELCMNCLKPGHFSKQCGSNNRCRKCQKLHHTLIHSDARGSSQSEQSAPVAIQQDNTIVILPVNKGNSTMIMDKTEYREKIHDLLSDQSYHPLRKDPTLRLERKINTTLKEDRRDRPTTTKDAHTTEQLPSTVTWASQNPQATSSTSPNSLFDKLSHIPSGQRAHANPDPTPREDTLTSKTQLTLSRTSKKQSYKIRIPW